MNNLYKGFASDNNSGVSPEVLEMLQKVNNGHCVGYGADEYTKKATELFKDKFGENAVPFFTFTGTGANVLGITTLSKSFHAVICASTAHIYEDECGAPEKFSGCKLIAINTPDGKLTPEIIKTHLNGFDFEHRSQPKIISITQPTEMGTLYNLNEITAIAKLAHQYGMFFHMDGARLANAAVSLGKSFREITFETGVDVLSFGGTKNGLMAAESVIFFNEDLVQDFKYFRKQSMQLASKMRYISAQFIAYFKNDLWRKNASVANEMANLLYEKVKGIKGIKITQKVEANGVFAIVPKHIIEPLRKKYFFYDWNEATGEVRWMTSFDTTSEEIEDFVNTIQNLMNE